MGEAALEILGYKARDDIDGASRWKTHRVLWQRGYYEHVIRNDKALNRIRDYIADNPAQWADDPDNVSGPGSAEKERV